MLRKTAAVILCVALICAVLVVPASAAAQQPVYDPSDYVSDVVVEGETKRVTFSFDGIVARTLAEKWDGTGRQFYDGGFIWYPDAGDLGVFFRTFYLGVNNWGGNECYGGAIDVSSIRKGASVDVCFTWDMSYSSLGFENVSAESPITMSMSAVLYLYDSSGNWVGEASGPNGTYTIPNTHSGYSPSYVSTITLPFGVDYVVPYFQVNFRFPSAVDGCWIHVIPKVFSMTADTNMIYEQSETMQAISDKLDEIGGKLDDTNDKLDDMNDTLDDIKNQPEQEKQEASSDGDSNVGALTGAIPDYSQGFIEALQGLANSMSYAGTDAVLPIPAVDFPEIDGLIAGFRILEPTELDFGVYIQMLPGALLLLVQSLFTMALIVYCFKELYGVIAYFLTLNGGGG